MSTKSHSELIVGVGEMAVSAQPDEVLATYALGSCLGIVIYDPVAKVGGMLHAMLPESKINPARAKVQPDAYVDTGLPRLFKAAYELGAVKKRMVVRVAGGSSSRDTSEGAIGKRNFLVAKKMLWRNSVRIVESMVGGRVSRTLRMSLSDGRLQVTVVDDDLRSTEIGMNRKVGT